MPITCYPPSRDRGVPRSPIWFFEGEFELAILKSSREGQSRRTGRTLGRRTCGPCYDCRSRLSSNHKIRSRLPELFPVVDVFAHEGFVGRGRADDAVCVRAHAAGDAEAAVDIDPLVLLAGETALDLLEVRKIVDLA